MFKLQPDPTFTQTVWLTVPGQAEPDEVTIFFRHRGIAALKEFHDWAENKTDAETVPEIVAGWEDFDTEFSRDALIKLIDSHPCAARELFAAYRQGLLESRVKN